MMRLADINHRHEDALKASYALVPGEGSPHARLMLIGEAPGAQEAQQGRPFVGTAGKNLDAFLADVGLAREALYITNAVKFRPTKQGASGRLSNRTPTPQEVALFRPWLLAEIKAVQPEVIATLGNTALSAVTGEKLVIGGVHGKLLQTEQGPLLFPLYHPASVIYRPGLKAVYEADLQALRVLMEARGAG